MIFKNEASEILRKDPRKVPAEQVEVKRKTIEDYISAVKYAADMKEDREKALADDRWLEVER